MVAGRGSIGACGDYASKVVMKIGWGCRDRMGMELDPVGL